MLQSTKLAYTEAYRVLQLMDDETRAKIPENVQEFLNKNKDLSLGEPLIPAIPLENQIISQEGWHVIAYLSTFF